MFEYVFAEQNVPRGKRTWKPDWHLPPGVSGRRAALQVLLLCGVAAIPVFWMSSNKETTTKQPDIYMVQKQKAREERMRWIESDDMPKH